MQLLLAPGERRSVALDLPPGAIACAPCIPARLSTSSMRRRLPRPARHRDGRRGDAPGRGGGKIAFANDAGFELAALIEDRTWTREALTAPEVISLQVFRDLFAEATLRPGDEAAVGQVALLFTDLRGSTALYERVGDAAAFNIVREHFAFLASIVRDHDGAVVKTIGDAVMASFGDPADAVKAALAMQARIADSTRQSGPRAQARRPCRRQRGGEPERPARLFRLDREHGGPPAGPEQGGDIVLSRAVADDPAVRDILASTPKRREAVALKGFAEPVEFVRLLDVTQDQAPPPVRESSSDAPR